MNKHRGTRTLRCTVIAVVLAVAAATTGWSATTQDQARRTARTYQGNGSIVQIAGAHSEEVIEVLYGFTPSTMHHPEGVSAVERLAELAPNILLVTVVAKSSRIDQTGMWIVTDVAARVVEVIKSDGLIDARPGVEVSFVEQGGEVEVSSKTVRGIVPWALPFELGNQYLLFFQVDPYGEMQVSPTSSYERVLDVGFRRMRTGGAARMTEGATEEVLRTVRTRAGGGR